MIIFGTKHDQKKKGYTGIQYTCRNCRAASNWSLIEYTSWFSLFFIPIIPYSRKEMLVCLLCDCGVMTTSAEGVQMMQNVTRFA